MPRSQNTRRRVVLALVSAVLTGLTCVALFGAAALVPAPPIVLPFIAAACIGCPMLAGWELREALADRRRGDSLVLARMRRQLAQLPETRHPLGL